MIVTAGLFGSEFPAANIAPIGVLITFWVGMQFVSMLLGDVWRALSPFETAALAGAWVRSRARHEALAPVEADDDASHRSAAVAVAGFVWLELAYHAPTRPKILGGIALAYGVVMLAAAARWGRDWLRTGEGFAALFSLFAAMAPFTTRAGERSIGDGRRGRRPVPGQLSPRWDSNPPTPQRFGCLGHAEPFPTVSHGHGGSPGQLRLVMNLTVSLMVGWVVEVAVRVRASEAPGGAVCRTVTVIVIRWVPPGTRLGVV